MPEIFHRSKPVQEFMAPHGKGGGGQRRAPRIQPPATPSGTRLSRGRLIGLGAAGVGMVGLMYLGAQRGSDQRPPATPTPLLAEPPKPPVLKAAEASVKPPEAKPKITEAAKALSPIPEANGEVENTKQHLAKLREELETGRNIEALIPRISELAIIYFSTQMTELFPDRVADYARDRFKDRIEFLSELEYHNKILECKKTISQEDRVSLAMTDGVSKRVWVNKAHYQHNRAVDELFGDIIHELHHMVPPVRKRDVPITPFGINQPISHEFGIAAFPNLEVNTCSGSFRGRTDEIVVEDSTLRLAQRVQVTRRNAYSDQVTFYRTRIIGPLFRDDYKELLGYQQTTEPDLFYEAIGKKKNPTVEEKQSLIIAGNLVMRAEVPGVTGR